MKAVLLSTGQRVFVLDNVSSSGSKYYTVLLPFAQPSKAGNLGDVRTIRREKVRLVKGTAGIED